MNSVKCAYDEMVDITQVIPNPQNPNTHNEKQIELLAKIIEYQGWRSPITVSKRSGFVVRGHGRLLAGQKLGCEMVPVDFQDYDNEADEWADMIADNRIAELSDINEIQLKALLYELNDSDFDLELTGYEDLELDEESELSLDTYEEGKERDDGDYLCALECAGRIMERIGEGAKTQRKTDLEGLCDSCTYLGYCMFEGIRARDRLCHVAEVITETLL